MTILATAVANGSDALLEGGHLLRVAFRRGRSGSCGSGAILIRAGEASGQVYQVRTGIAYRSHEFPDGRRAIVDLYVPGDLIGIEALLSMPAPDAIVAAGPVRYRALEPDVLRHRLLENSPGGQRIAALFFEAQARVERLAARLARLDAPERVAAMLLDVYDRMRRRDMISRGTFNLRLTQQQIGDHLGLSGVHVNRVLRWMAMERIAFVERQVVIIRDFKRLRALAQGQEPLGSARPGAGQARFERTPIANDGGC